MTMVPRLRFGLMFVADTSPKRQRGNPGATTFTQADDMTRLIAFTALAALAAAAPADVIRLKGGQTLQGEVLKEVEGTLYVDVGVDVVRVPKDEVLSRQQGDAEKPIGTD